IMPFLRQQFARASLRQTRVEQIAGNRIGHRMVNSAKQPVMIEEHKHDLHVRAADDLECSVDVVEKLLVEAGGKTAIVVDNSRSAVAEDEPSRHHEPERRHIREVASDGVTPCGHAKMRSPDVSAEVQTVKNSLAIG